MKSSPLTDSEKCFIQEGLVLFKYDWKKVWQYCVPHRDPAVLPRQWRIAVGTQKSYKTSETSKERRRLYEANRRQRIATKKASSATVAAEEVLVGRTLEVNIEDAHPSCTGTGVEGHKDADDPDGAAIREAFLDDRSLRSSPVVTSGPTGATAEREKELSLSLSKRKKTNSHLQCHLSSSSPWLNSRTVKTVCQSGKQTVKLAPGLPLVKLPPCVQILSQSQVQPQQTSVSTTRLVPITSQWTEVAIQGPRKLQSSIRASQVQSLSLSNCAAEATTQEEGVSSSNQSTVTSCHSFARLGQTLLKKKSGPFHLPPFGDQRYTQFLHPMDDSVVEKSDHPDLDESNHLKVISRQSCFLSNSFSPLLQHCPVQGYSQIRAESNHDELQSIQRLVSLPAQSRKVFPAVTKRSDHQDNLASPTSQLVPMKAVSCNVIQPCTATTTLDTGSGLELCGIHSPIQASPITGLAPPSSSDCKLKSKSMLASEVCITDSVPQGALVQREVGERNDVEFAEQGDSIARINLAKTNETVLLENSREARNGNRRTVSSSSIAKYSQKGRPMLLVEGGISELSADRNTESCQGRDTKTERIGIKKDQKGPESRIEKGRHNPYAEQHIIVMEQEELSDSEDEADAGVEFEHEEMGDSDKDADVEPRSTKHWRAYKPN